MEATIRFIAWKQRFGILDCENGIKSGFERNWAVWSDVPGSCCVKYVGGVDGFGWA